MTAMTAIEERLRQTGLFQALGPDELATLGRDVQAIALEPGEVVVREGEPGDALYVIDEGTAQVFTFGQDGREVVLAKIGAGAYFGEQALVPGRSERRNAYVRAFSRARLLRVGKDDFQRALARDSPLRQRLQEIGEEQLRDKLASQSLLFRTLRLGDVDALWRTERFEAGATVFREGEPGDRFYVILSGTASVYREEDGVPKLVVSLREGQGFGELALLRREARAATVVAQGPLTAMSIDGARFLELYERTPELREYVQTLHHVYLLPGRGFTTQHAGKFLGLDAITTLYHLSSGRRVVASRVIGRDLYHATAVREGGLEPRTIRFRDPASGDEREIAVAGDQLVGVTVRGSWPELGEAHALVLDGRRLEPWQEEVFRERGSLRLEEDAHFFEDGEPICACVQVTRGTLRRCIQEGCESETALSDRTGAGTVCGACRPRLKEMLGRPDWTPVVCSEVIRVTDEVRSFRFRPCSGGLKPARPGQHIVAQARIDDRWVERPYTLSSAGAETGFYEITVKREPHGLFSSWLFDRMQGEVLIRVSSPQGDFVLEDDAPAPPAVCIVGGIGVTPALAMLRSVVAGASGRRLHIDYSCSHARQFAYLDELRRAAAGHSGITLRARATREAGHIERGDIAALDAELPAATYFVCGPTAFQRHVKGILADLGVPRGRIRTEEFTPQGDKPPVGAARRTRDATAAAAAVGHPAAKAPPTRAPGPRPGDRPAVPEVLASQPASVRDEARAYLERFFLEHGVPQAFEARWRQVEAEIERTGTYEQTYDELSFGARLAWRNSARCIGRLFWHGLQVRDLRRLETEEQVFEALCEHIRLATNGGNLRAVMSVFAPGRPGEPAPRLWNPQLIRYAGYRQRDGTWIGDPANAAVTRAILKLGWRRPKRERTHFDILPLVIELPHRPPKLFEVPKDLILEVPLTHPEYPWFAELGLRWYALPAVSEMLFDCGGIRYTLAPFNGWYMGTEIGARNFSDEYRYNRLPAIAERLRLDTRRDRTLWKDRALVELNIAVLHSFERAGVKMVDHHAAANDFMEFAAQEAAAGRRIDARWSWIVPPLSGSTTPVFHVGWHETEIKPNYFYQPKPYRKAREGRAGA